MDLLNFYRHKRLLITGSTGYIGSCLIGWLKDLDCHITRLSRPGTIFPPIRGRAQLKDVMGNLQERATWEKVLQEGIDLVFHLAAQTNCYTSNMDPLLDQAANFMPLLQLLEACRRNDWRPGVILAGTVTQIGVEAQLPANEEHPDQPTTIYDVHKLIAESYLAYYARQEMVDGVTLRLANVYGPGPESSGKGRGMLNGMIRQALQGKPLTIYGQGDFVRDFVYIEDIVRAFLLAGVHIGSLQGRHFVIGSGRGCTLAEVIGLVSERTALKTGQRVPVIYVTPPAGLLPIEFRHFVADSTRALCDLGWHAHIPLEQGIDRTIEHLLVWDGV